MRKISHGISFLRFLVSAQVFVASWQKMLHCARVDGPVQNGLITVNSKILSNAAAAFNGKFERQEQ